MSRSLVETCVRRRTVWKGAAVDFRVDTIRLPNGKRATREFLDHPGAVAVVPMLDRDTVVLVRQFRYPVGEVTYEIPAGKLSKGEAPLACVRRELREETGYRARRVRRLLSYWPTPAFANEVLHIFAAEGLVPGPAAPDDDEFVETALMPLRRAVDLVLSGRIRDSKTIIALLAVERLSRRRGG